jgi:hypothetical protein
VLGIGNTKSPANNKMPAAHAHDPAPASQRTLPSSVKSSSHLPPHTHHVPKTKAAKTMNHINSRISGQ